MIDDIASGFDNFQTEVINNDIYNNPTQDSFVNQIELTLLI